MTNPFPKAKSYTEDAINPFPKANSSIEESVNPFPMKVREQASSDNPFPVANYPRSRPKEVSEEEKFGKMGPFYKGIDILSRPGYAVKAGIAEQLSQSHGDSQKDVGERYMAMWRGLNGHERVQMNELYSKYGISGIPLLGFASEVALDPLTYTPAGWYSIAAKLITAPAKAANKIPAIEKATSAFITAAKPVLEKTTVAVTKAANPLLRTLSTRVKPLDVKAETWDRFLQISDEADRLKKYGTDKSLQFAKEIQASIQGLKKTGKVSEEGIDTLLQSLERRGTVASLPDELHPLFDKLSNWADTIHSRRGAVEKGLITEKGYNYWVHTLSSEEQALLKKSTAEPVFRKYATKSVSDIQRDILTYVDVDTGKRTVSTLEDLGALPLTLKGISEENLTSMFMSTVRDLADFQKVAKVCQRRTAD